MFRKIVRKVFEPGRSFSPHGLRHTFASLHMARGTNLKWIQSMGGWASAKLLLDLYGHYLKTESSGFADTIAAPRRPLQNLRAQVKHGAFGKHQAGSEVRWRSGQDSNLRPAA